MPAQPRGLAIDEQPHRAVKKAGKSARHDQLRHRQSGGRAGGTCDSAGHDGSFRPIITHARRYDGTARRCPRIDELSKAGGIAAGA